MRVARIASDAIVMGAMMEFMGWGWLFNTGHSAKIDISIFLRVGYFEFCKSCKAWLAYSEHHSMVRGF